MAARPKITVVGAGNVGASVAQYARHDAVTIECHAHRHKEATL